MLCNFKQNIHLLRDFNNMIRSCVVSHIEKTTPNSQFTLWYYLSTLFRTARLTELKVGTKLFLKLSLVV